MAAAAAADFISFSVGLAVASALIVGGALPANRSANSDDEQSRRAPLSPDDWLAGWLTDWLLCFTALAEAAQRAACCWCQQKQRGDLDFVRH